MRRTLLLACLCLTVFGGRACFGEEAPQQPPATQPEAPTAPAPPSGQEAQPPQAAQPAAAHKEIVHGTVLDAATGKPLAGATVAIRTRDGKVLGWSKTDAEGDYEVEGSYAQHVRLPNYRDKDHSILGSIRRGAGRIFRVAKQNIGRVVKPAAKAAGSAVGGPIVGDVAAQVAGQVTPAPENPLPEVPDPDNPAVFVIKVTCPGYQDYQGPVQAFWMDPPDDDQGDITLDFWLDAIALAPRTDDTNSKLRSGPRAQTMRLREATLEPSIVPRGAQFTISVRMTMPPEAAEGVKVLARSERTEEMIALEPVPGDPGLFRGQMKVGADWPLNDQRIVILALRAVPASADGPRSAVPEVLAEKLSLWTARKLVFDPQILASRDREVLTLTVVE